ncbi:MAG: peptidoglycan editing factor PgeF [Candidatus Omnitrophota bacterium]
MMHFVFPSFEGFPVEMGVTTRDFPLFFSSVSDLDDPERTASLQNMFPASQYWVYPEQIHGPIVTYLLEEAVRSGGRFQKILGTDGLLTNAPHTTLSILTADCLPIFFLAPEPLTIGLIHVGWRGCVGAIAQAAVEQLCCATRQSPAVFQVVFGPCIRDCCYQVGEAFRDGFPESVLQRGGLYYLDLVKENRRQLVSAGIKEENIHGDPLCTCCHAETFYSYRKEKEKAGRMLSWIRIRNVLA